MEIAGIPVSLLLLSACIVVFATVVQTTIGMGFGQVAAPLLAMIDTRMVPVPIIMLGTITAIIAATKERGEVRKGEVTWGLAGRATGTLGAMLLLLMLPSRESFTILFALGILLAVAMSVAGIRMKLNRQTLLSMGTLSGFMGTITSVGAPPMGLLYQDVKADHARPTLNAFFAIGAAISLAGLALIGRIGASDLLMVAIFAPVMLATTHFAPRLNASVARRYRPIVLGMSAVAAVNLLFRALMP